MELPMLMLSKYVSYKENIWQNRVTPNSWGLKGHIVIVIIIISKWDFSPPPYNKQQNLL